MRRRGMWRAKVVAELAPFDTKLHAWVHACFRDGQWTCHRQQAKWTPRSLARLPARGSTTLRGLCGNNKQVAGCKSVSKFVARAVFSEGRTFTDLTISVPLAP